MKQGHVWVVGDGGDGWCEPIQELSAEGYSIERYEGSHDVCTAPTSPDVVFIRSERDPIDNVQLLGTLRAAHPRVPCFLVTDFEPEALAPLHAARRTGLRFDVVSRPLTLAKVRAIVGVSAK